MTEYSIGDILYSDEIGWHILLVSRTTFSHPNDKANRLTDWEAIIIETGQTNWYEEEDLDRYFEKVA